MTENRKMFEGSSWVRKGKITEWVTTGELLLLRSKQLSIIIDHASSLQL